MDLASKLKLYIVLETSMLKLPLDEFLKEVLKAGVSTIQLRDKNSSFEEKLKIAQIIRLLTNEFNALFIINDSVELAVKSHADGLHLGINDGNIKEIKEINDGNIKEIKENYPNLIIGYSCNNLDDVNIANQYADYAGIGPYTNTSTKKDIRQILGSKGIYKLNKALNIPSVAIGGINSENAKDVLLSNVSGLAVSSYLCASEKPYEDAVKIMDIINERV